MWSQQHIFKKQKMLQESAEYLTIYERSEKSHIHMNTQLLYNCWH